MFGPRVPAACERIDAILCQPSPMPPSMVPLLNARGCPMLRGIRDGQDYSLQGSGARIGAGVHICEGQVKGREKRMAHGTKYILEGAAWNEGGGGGRSGEAAGGAEMPKFEQGVEHTVYMRRPWEGRGRRRQRRLGGATGSCAATVMAAHLFAQRPTVIALK